MDRDICDSLPDVRDGLTRRERIVLWLLHRTQAERGGRHVPTTMLWGRVCEYFYISPEDLSAMLARLGAMRSPPLSTGLKPKGPQRRLSAAADGVGCP